MRLRETDFGAVAHQRAVEASYFYAGGALRREDGAGLIGGSGCCPCQQYERREPHDCATARRAGPLPPTTALRCSLALVWRLQRLGSLAGRTLP